jgi:hypothetical protein
LLAVNRNFLYNLLALPAIQRASFYVQGWTVFPREAGQKIASCIFCIHAVPGDNAEGETVRFMAL